MSYATVAEFVAAFPAEAGVLTNLEDPASTVVDELELQGALDTASAEIDLYLRGRYVLPLESLVPLDPEDPEALPVYPGVLVGWCRDIARYRLDRVRPSEDVRRRYDDAIRGLEAIAAGKWIYSSLMLGAGVLGRSRAIGFGMAISCRNLACVKASRDGFCEFNVLDCISMVISRACQW